MEFEKKKDTILQLRGFAKNLCLFIGVLTAALILGVSVFGQSGSSGNLPNNPLPQTPPAPGILFRDSFGWGPQGLRPAGNGVLRNSLEVANINDFWVEYLGSKNQKWLAPPTNPSAPIATWNFCGTEPDPYEIFSPLQIVNGAFFNGCVLSGNSEGAAFPTALMPLPGGLNNAFDVSIDGFAIPGPNSYLAVGLTNSNQTAGNFFAFGSAVLVIRNQSEFSLNTILFELRAGNFSGPILAHGIVAGNGFVNQLKIRYNPRTKTLGGQINGTVIDPVQVNFSTPKYVGFEGFAVVDNFVVSSL
ncbi:MAG TPA: hypothetical protein PKY59_25175 [Pyrinomonadaceae bacterium]|nr:hypothetical protein [Pyrinomonadaceae bacterium]